MENSSDIFYGAMAAILGETKNQIFSSSVFVLSAFNKRKIMKKKHEILSWNRISRNEMEKNNFLSRYTWSFCLRISVGR